MATGAIAIGTTATSTSTITIILTGTTTRTSTGRTSIVVKLARATGGSITRNIAEMHRMVIEELRTSSAAMRVSSLAAVLEVVVEPVVRVGLVELAELDVRVAQEALEALAVPEDQVVPAGRAVLVGPEGRVALAVPENRAAWVVLVGPDDPVVQAAWVVLVAPGGPGVPAVWVVLGSPGVLVALLVRPIVPAEAVPERDQPEARRRIRSATDLHHRGRVVAQRVEDSAVVAETMRGPAATEAERAWAAAE